MSYTTIKLPTPFVEKHIDSLVEQVGSGFSSRAEVVKAAIREFSIKTPIAEKIENEEVCPV